MELHINPERLTGSLAALGRCGALPGGGVSRVAFTDADRAGREFVKARMAELGMAVRVDAIGNIFATLEGSRDLPPLMIGSHIDTAAAADLYDGNYGVLSGLEVAASLRDGGIVPRRPLVVAAFANEEGVRYQPDMMGSLVLAGGLSLAEALDRTDLDGVRLEEALDRTEPARERVLRTLPVHRYLELHIEQGPLLDSGGTAIGVVEAVQGISWAEYTVTGVANHAGTTPMHLRHDAGYAAAAIMVRAHELAVASDKGLVATVGRVSGYHPGMINVIADRVVFSLDMRCADDAALSEAERRVHDYATELAEREGVTVARRELERFPPVAFAPDLAARTEAACREAGLAFRRMTSGAVHDAQMLARLCPAGMIFVPNRGGLSHNVREYVEPEHVVAGAEVLYRVALGILLED